MYRFFKFAAPNNGHIEYNGVMKKFLRNLFSGYFLILLVLLLELGLLVTAQYFLDNLLETFGIAEGDQLWKLWVALAYVLAKLIVFIVGVIIFFKIISKFEDPEFKIPWIVSMLLFPFFTSIIFLIFGNHGLRRRDRRIIEASNNAYASFFAASCDDQEEALGNAIGTFRYLQNTTMVGAHHHNRVTYYKNGEEFFPAMMEGLKQAKEFIFIEFFIITDGKLWDETVSILKQKAQEGVDVRIVYDDMGCGGTISASTPKRLAKFGIKCYKFHPFRPILSGAYNNRDHRKIVVIDHQMAFTGGCNLADEYANIITRFGYWKDTMVKIEGSAINNLIAIFLQNHDLATGKVSDYLQFLTHDYPVFEEEGFVMPFADAPGSMDNALVGEQNYINILAYAKKKAYISTPYLIPTYSLLDALRNASLRGVEVHLILPGIPDKKMVYKIAKSHFPYLLESGVHIHIYEPGFNHMKTALIDDEIAFVGTINFDFRSLVHHFECGTVLYKNPCLQVIHDDFEEMLAQSKEIDPAYQLSPSSRRLCALLKIFTPLL